MSQSIETEEDFFERVSEECHMNGHQWVERKDAPTESLSPFLAAKIQKMQPAPQATGQSIYGRICKHCGEYGLECVSCDKPPEELEDHYLSLQSWGQCYNCRGDEDEAWDEFDNYDEDFFDAEPYDVDESP